MATIPNCLGLYKQQAGLWLKSVGSVQKTAAIWLFVLHSSNEPGELSKYSKHNDSTKSIVSAYYYYYYYY